MTTWEYFFGKPGELDEDLRSIGISRKRLVFNAGGKASLLCVYSWIEG